MRNGLVYFIRAYKRIISPFIIRSCRYEPTCSEYAITAIEEYGTIRGTFLAAWRLLRCNPFSRGGYDPVIKKERTGKI